MDAMAEAKDVGAVEHHAGCGGAPVVRSAVACRGLGRAGLVVGDVQNMVIVGRCIEPGALSLCPLRSPACRRLIAFASARGR
jgi:hypothetical protein